MTAIPEHFDVLVRGGSLARAFHRAEREMKPSARSRLRLWTSWGQVSRRDLGHVFIISTLRDLTSESELAKARNLPSLSKRFLLFMGPERVPAESIAESVVELGARSKQRLHLARLESDDELSFLRRFVAGLLSSDQDGSIMDAWWDRDELVVISPTFQRLRIPLASMPRLRDVALKHRQRFEIDPQGDFIYWPSHDIHMGWPQFQQAVDPQARLRAQQKHEQFNERYGRAIRALRESKGLSQQDINGLDERTVRRIEQGKTRATANALSKLAKAHRMTPPAYLNAVAKSLAAPDEVIR
ncbi:MAG TPA: helix-turn-helix domain-containing protein [Tepidisphaeraceae bacterium]|jgi:hypothetical protein